MRKLGLILMVPFVVIASSIQPYVVGLTDHDVFWTKMGLIFLFLIGVCLLTKSNPLE